MPLIPWRNNPNLNEELQTLMEKMEQLGSMADDIQCQVQNEELQARKKRKSEVTLWLERVRDIKGDVQSISREVKNIGNCNSRELLKEMKGMMEHIDQLIKQGEFSQGLILDDLKLKGIELVTEKLEGSTPLKVQNEVWSAFARGESRIGIYGMGGVGKTSVAMHFNNDIVSGRDDFKHVYYVTVSQCSSVDKLQDNISTALKLNLQNEDETRRAAELHMSLKNREKSLLILDDIWEYIPMEKVGVAVEGGGCNLLITTRKRDVCRKMKCSTIVEMKPLPEIEAWDLFVSQLGGYELLSDEAKGVAKSIAKESSGLPLGIITMARCMRGELNEHVWRDMLRQLRNASTEQDDMEDKVFRILKLSYEHLNNAKLRECFLYCALYPEDYRIKRDELIDRFIAVELIDESTREENIDKGHSLLNSLEGASLLESETNGDGERCVKMHDLVRDMAIKIIGCKGIVKAGKGLEEIPRKDEWTKDLVQVSLMENEIRNISDEICPACPNLSVLILCHNPLESISQSLFVHMVALRILDLSYTRISKLPKSISNLSNLSALSLKDCRHLEIISSLAGLSNLRKLDLHGCSMIKEWPKGVEELKNLEHLDMHLTEIQSILDGVVSKLSKLECFVSNYRIGILPKTLMSLRQLRRFEGKIDDLDAFNQLVGSGYFKQLKMYSLWVGGNCEEFEFSQAHRRVMIIGAEASFKLPHNVQSLDLFHCSFGVKNILDSLPSLCSATELEQLFLDDCKGIEYMISGAWFEQGGAELERRFMVSIPFTKFQDDFDGLTERGMVGPYIWFDALTKLQIFDCPRVNKIWLRSDDLPNLKYIEVIDCGNMEELFATTGGATTEVKCFPKLQKLMLHNLLELKSICRKGVFFPKLRFLLLEMCPKLKRFGLLNQNLTSLQTISISDCAEMEEIFSRGDEGRDGVIQLPNLLELSLVNLPELRSISSKAIACSSIKEVYIFGLSTGMKLENIPISVPRLLLNKNYSHPQLYGAGCNPDPREWWNSLNWNDPHTQAIFNQLGCFY